MYRDENNSDRQTKIARKESLSLKLALRPNMDELISRNILHMQSENERQESKEAIGARLIRRLSMRPTMEELLERNILKSSKISYHFIVVRSNQCCLKTFFSYIASGGKETKGREEAISAAKVKLSTDS